MAVIHLIGAPGSGKTHLRTALASVLALHATGIDDHRARVRRPGEPAWPPMHESLAWWRLGRSVRKRQHAIVETYGTNRREERLFEGLRVLRVLVEVDSMTRYRRLRERDPAWLDELINTPSPPVEYDLWWDGAAPTSGPRWDDFVARLQTFLGDTWPDEDQHPRIQPPDVTPTPPSGESGLRRRAWAGSTGAYRSPRPG